MRNKIDKSKEIIAEKLDLPREVVMDLPKITIIANTEINIEGHKGILMFTENEIQVNTKQGIVVVTGRNLEISYLGGSTITLKGFFNSVLYDKNDQ